MAISSISFAGYQNSVNSKQYNNLRNKPQNAEDQVSFKGKVATETVKKNSSKILTALAGFLGIASVKNAMDTFEVTNESPENVVIDKPTQPETKVFNPIKDKMPIASIPNSVIKKQENFEILTAELPIRPKAENKVSDEVLAQKISEAKIQGKDCVNIIQNVKLNQNPIAYHRYTYYEKQSYDLNGNLLKDIVFDNGKITTKTYDAKSGLLTSETVMPDNYDDVATKTIFNEDGTIRRATYTPLKTEFGEFSYEVLDADGTVLEKGEQTILKSHRDYIAKCLDTASCDRVKYSYNKATGAITKNGVTFDVQKEITKEKYLKNLNQDIAKALSTPIAKKEIRQEEYSAPNNRDYLISVNYYYDDNGNLICQDGQFDRRRYFIRTENGDTAFDINIKTNEITWANVELYENCEKIGNVTYNSRSGLNVDLK